jgi:two-component system, cell cycle sensor histidine kinase and response regulator CckA
LKMTNGTSVEDWKQTLDALPELICTLDSAHKVRWMNAAMAKRLAVTPAEAIGRSCYEAVHGTNDPPHYCPHRQMLQDHQAHEVEIHEKRLGGDFLVTCTPQRNEAGQVIGSIFVARDITKRKRVERKLQKSEALYRSFFQANPHPMWVYDLETLQFLAINNAAVSQYGYSLDEFLSMTIKDIRPPEDLPRLYKNLEELPAEGLDNAGVWSHVKKDGSVIDVEITSHLLEFDGRKAELVLAHDITARLQAEKRLRESNERLKKVLQVETVGVMFWDLTTGCMIDANDTFLKMMGYSREEVESRSLTWQKLTPPEYMEASQTEIRKFQETGRVGPYEKEYYRKDGTRQWMVFAGSSLGGETCVEFCVDISDRIKVEEQLRESEHHFRTLANGGNALIWTSGPDKLCDYFNEPWLRYTGRTMEQELGDGWAEGVHPDDLDRCLSIYVSHFDRRESFSVEYRLRKANGEYDWILDLGNPRHDSEGRFNGYIGYCYDITARKQAEKSLAENEERLRLALRAANQGLYDLNVQTGVAIVSSEYASMLGYDPETFVETNAAWIERLHPDDKETIAKAYSDYISGESAEYRVEFRQKTRDGAWRWILSLGKVIEFDVDRKPLRMLGTHTDINERKRSEEEKEKLQAQLTQAQKMESVARLAGGVAHDFNNMLGVILGYARMAQERIAPDEPLHADLDEIRLAAERSADLTRQLLAFARKQTVAPQVLDINEAVEGMLKMLRRLIGEDIDLAWRPVSRSLSVFIDPSQVDQILANLCVNARDAIAGVGRVIIETDAATFDEDYCSVHAGFVPGDFVMLAVSDTGCGIDETTLGHLFEPFFTTKELGKGTGLGLATVYGAVKQNNGFINVYSEPGHGTTFRIYLPLHLPKATSRFAQKQVPPKNASGQIILLVEDEMALLKMTTRMLKGLGYTVIAASTPGEAIHLAREFQGRIDLLMTDVVMPEMNGRNLANNLMSLYPNIRCLFMSGYTANVIAHHGVLDRGIHFLQKPFSVQDLAAKLQEALGE